MRGRNKPDLPEAPAPDRERFCIHSGAHCPYAASCMYNSDTSDCKMQVCEAAIQTGIMKCAACQSRDKCKETWSCFRFERWNRKRAGREVRS